jgi:hypothetical protein
LVNIPASALLLAYASDSTSDVFERAYKAGLAINIMSLSVAEIAYLSLN